MPKRVSLSTCAEPLILVQKWSVVSMTAALEKESNSYTFFKQCSVFQKKKKEPDIKIHHKLSNQGQQICSGTLLCGLYIWKCFYFTQTKLLSEILALSQIHRDLSTGFCIMLFYQTTQMSFSLLLFALFHSLLISLWNKYFFVHAQAKI